MVRRFDLKKLIALFLPLICIVSMSGCQLTQPEFEDFKEYQEDFVSVKDFIIDFNFTRNDASPLIVDINSQFLTIAGDEISDSSIEEAVKTIYDKGFTYIEINDDCIIFWEDETGYYGVLWSASPKDAINRIKSESRPQMKSQKLSDEWYEVGALELFEWNVITSSKGGVA